MTNLYESITRNLKESSNSFNVEIYQIKETRDIPYSFMNWENGPDIDITNEGDDN